MPPPRFDLDTAVAAWRRSLSHRPALSEEDLDELERHVRDEVDALVACGAGVEAAFGQALGRMGAHGAVEAEYGKVFWGKARRRGALFAEVAARFALLRHGALVAVRALGRHPGVAALNVTGLAVGIACCALIGLYVAHELSYDRFHAAADRIHRVSQVDHAMAPAAVGPALETQYGTVVAEATRLWPLFAPAKMRRGETVFVETEIAFADPSVFRVFTFPLRQGDAAAALDGPRQIVLTASMAEKYFGAADPLGETVTFWGQDLRVAGVMDDVPANAHYRFDALISLATLDALFGSTEGFGMYTYVRLHDAEAGGRLDAALARLAVAQPGGTVLRAQPLTRLHLFVRGPGEPGPGGSPERLVLLAAAALFILLLACVNFVNLATARAALRAREVGLRKAFGAARSGLAAQFFGETLLLATAALGVGAAAAVAVLPLFNAVAGTSLGFQLVPAPALAGTALGLLAVVTLAAGAYPALHLTSFRPVAAFRTAQMPTGAALRRLLVVVQLGAAVALVTATTVVQQQLAYVEAADLGYDAGRVVVLDGDRHEQLKAALLERPQVAAVSGAPSLLGGPLPRGRFESEGRMPDTTETMLVMPVLADYAATLGLRLVAGRDLSAGATANDEFVLNEAAIARLGWTPEAAVGRSFALRREAGGETPVWRRGRVVGVVADFHHAALYAPVEPVALHAASDLNHTLVRLGRVDEASLQAVEAAWREVNPDAPFNAFGLDAHLAARYAGERTFRDVFAVFTGLALLTATLGLFGLAAFTTGRRRREIGIRKVLGASVRSLLVLLTREAVVLAAVAVAVAAPVALVGMRAWLGAFTYRADLGIETVLVPAAFAFGITLVAVCSQVLRAATADPATVLRDG